MSRRIWGAAALAAGWAIVLGSVALASPYEGAATTDERMSVAISVSDGAVSFAYADVLTQCSDGSEVRQGGAAHTDQLNDRNRFKDRLEVGDTTSVVRGRVRRHKARGTLTYDLVYAGGECHSGEVEWRAKRAQ